MKRLLILCLLFPVISLSQTIIKGYDYCRGNILVAQNCFIYSNLIEENRIIKHYIVIGEFLLNK